LASVALTSSLFGNPGLANIPTDWLNVASYSGYHRFASTTRILAGTPETQPEKPERASESDRADGTGGTFLHNSNDLEAAFKSLADAPETMYLFELSLDNVKPDVTFPRLKVKVNRDGLQLQARHGYLMPKPEKAKD
jgi:hypothetical protein